MARTQEFKVGDLVRVRKTGDCWHGFKSGQVVEIKKLQGWGGQSSRYVCVGGYMGDTVDQSIVVSDLKLAKQAMKKREAYAARRG